MKKYYLLLLIFFASIAPVKNVYSQFVYVPDSAFRIKLFNLGLEQCFVGDSIDSTCVSGYTVLNLEAVQGPRVSNLQGIEAFHSLELLNLDENNLSTIPPLYPGLKYLSCEHNLLVSLPVLPDSLISFECGYNQLPSLPQLPLNLIYLDCISNVLTSLPALPDSLLSFDCGDNQISVLPTLPPALQQFRCYKNNLTSLPLLPNTISYVFCGYNQLTSLPTLPSSLIYLSCHNNPLSVLPALPTGLKTIYTYNTLLTTLPALPDTFYILNCDSCQLTSLPTLPLFINELYCSYNQLTYIPPLPRSMLYLFCDHNPLLTCLPVLNTINTLDFRNCPISCIPNQGHVSNSYPPLNSLPICNLFSPSSCTYTWDIAGKTFLTSSLNCTPLASDPTLAKIPVNLYKDGNLVQRSFSVDQGYFYFDVDSFGNFQVEVDTLDLPFDVICPGTNRYQDTLTSIDSIRADNNFSFKCKSTPDVGVWSIVASPFQPGRHSIINIRAGDVATIYGEKCYIVGALIIITLSSNLHYVAPAPGALIPSGMFGNTLTYNIFDLGSINSNTAFSIKVMTDNTAHIGDPACVSASINSVNGEANLSNNEMQNCFTIRASYDPNIKLVYPEGLTDTSQHWLTYTVQFQNTGSAPAQYIYILDTLDTNLDISTFQILAISHPSYAQILEGGVVKFNFFDINLPDSNTNEPLSHGFIQYKIRMKESLPIGTNILNTAHIYFDLNPAVVTNTTMNTIDIDNKVSSISNSLSIKIWPVPFDNYLKFESNDIGSHYTITNIIGNIITYGVVDTPRQVISTVNWSNGIYFLRIQGKNGYGVKKLICEK